MVSFFSFLTQKKIPARGVIHTLTEGPLTTISIWLYVLFFAILAITFSLLLQINALFLITVPARGGSITEGVIGAPQSLNPLLALTSTEQGLSTLIYSGLYKETTAGEYVPELAETYEISPDGKMYTFTLRPNITFHDKKPLTSADVAFTVQKMQDASINATLANYWTDIIVETPDPTTIVFHVGQSSTPFLEKTVFGILPKHIWESRPPEAYTEVLQDANLIGSGQYRVKNIYTQNGVPHEIVLKKNERSPLYNPYLDTIRIAIYANQQNLLEALDSQDIDTTTALLNQTVTAATITENYTVTPVNTDETLSLYRTGNDAVLGNSTMMTILHQYIDKDVIIATVENSYGTQGVPKNAVRAQSAQETIEKLESLGYTYTNGILSRNGSPIGFSIAVENDPETLDAAHAFATELGALGMIISIKAFDPGTFQDEVSSSLYSVILANTSNTIISSSYRKIFMLYTKTVPYVVDKNVHGVVPEHLRNLALHYSNTASWYTQTDKIWKWFVKK